MPKEARIIVFNSSEIYSAVYSLCGKRDMKKPPQGVIAHMAKEVGDTFTNIIITIADEGQGFSQKLEYDEDFVVAAFIAYCQGAGIPLPKNVQKSLLIDDATKTMALRFKM